MIPPRNVPITEAFGVPFNVVYGQKEFADECGHLQQFAGATFKSLNAGSFTTCADTNQAINTLAELEIALNQLVNSSSCNIKDAQDDIRFADQVIMKLQKLAAELCK